MVCGGTTGRFEVAEELVNLLGLSESITLTAVDSDYFKKEYYADRPPSERLLDTKLNLREVNVMRDWKICLAEYLDNYYQDYLDN